MEPQAVTPALVKEPEYLSLLINFWHYVARIRTCRQPAQESFTLASERTARDIGLSRIQIRFGHLARGTGFDAELRPE